MWKNKRNKYDITSIILIMLSMIPVVDSLNGFLLKSGLPAFGIGTIYRLVFLAVILTYLYSGTISKLSVCILFEFVLFLMIQFVISDSSYAKDSIESTVKLFTPILMISSFIKMKKRNRIVRTDIDRLFVILCVLFPITILIPYALHIGYSTYADNVGYKAFYYATNEISFSVCVIIMYLWQRINEQFSIKYLLLFFLNAATCVLIGSKVAIGVLAIFTSVLVFKNIVIKSRKRIGRNLSVLALFAIAASVVVTRFSGAIDKILNRWMYNQSVAGSNATFLFSHRNVFLARGYAVFSSRGLATMLFGWGLGGKNNNGLVFVEMDIFDILFGTGILGIFLITITYVMLIRKLKVSSRIGWLFIMLSISLSFVCGHILFTGLGGMMFALICLLSSMIEKKNICS